MPQSEENKTKYLPLSAREEELGRIIVNCSYKVYSALGPGLLEKVYEICLCHELRKSGLEVKRQVDIPVGRNKKICFITLDILIFVPSCLCGSFMF